MNTAGDMGDRGGLFALMGGRLIDGTGADPIENSVVVIQGPLIRQVGAAAQVKVPPGCAVRDVSGRTVMPGLFDCHAHVGTTTMSIEKRLFTPRVVSVFETAQVMKRTLHAGFTTVREPGTLNDPGYRTAVEMGLIEGPRLVMAGGLGQTGGHFDAYYPRNIELPMSGVLMCDGVNEVRKAARLLLRRGFDFLKVCTTGGVSSPADAPEHTEWTLEELRAIVYEASARGKAVMAHAEGNQGIKNALLAGAWSVEHGSVLDDEAIQMFLDTGAYLVPTLTVFERLAGGADMGLTEVAKVKAAELVRLAKGSFGMALAAGVKIAVGTDSIHDKMHGNNARELELMVRGGMTPMQAIVAATKVSSEACRVDARTGTLQPGKAADLLVVDGDPLEEIGLLRDRSRFSLVMKEGRAYVDRSAPTPRD